MNTDIANASIGEMLELTLDYMLVNTDTSICNKTIPSSANSLDGLISQFSFDKSWEWIMYAMEFITELNNLDDKGKMHLKIVEKSLLAANKKATFEALFYFSSWYNTQGKEK